MSNCILDRKSPGIGDGQHKTSAGWRAALLGASALMSLTLSGLASTPAEAQQIFRLPKK